MSTYVPSPSFPGAIPGDQNIPIAFPDASTTLTSAIDASVLSIPVANGSLFPLTGLQSTIIRINNEQIKVTGRTGNTLTVPPGGRGWNGTAAAIHAVTTEVRGVVSSYAFNRLREEVQAIAESVADARACDFVFLQGDFSGFNNAPGPQIITLRSDVACPRGLSGSDANHYIFLTNDIVAEVALITGGSAVSGVAGGTLQFTTAGNYSAAAVRIGSATAGLQEAFNVSPSVRLPAGSFALHGTCFLPYKATLTGAGPGATELIPGNAGMVCFTNANKTAPTTTYHWTIEDLAINGRAFATNTIKGFELVNTWQSIPPGTPPMNILQTDNNVTFRNLVFRNVRYAFWLDRVINAKLLNIEALDNTSTYIGDTTGGTSQRSYNVTVRGYLHHQQAAPTPAIPLSLAAGSWLLKMEHVNEGVIDDFHNLGANQDIDAIVIGGGCAFCTVCNSGVRVVRNGILVTGDATLHPQYTRIVNYRSNFCYAAGVNLDYADDTLISACGVHQNDGGAAPNGVGVRISANAKGVLLTGSVVQGFSSATGPGVKAEASALNFTLVASFFHNSAPASDIEIGSGCSWYVIMGNQKNITSSSTFLAETAAANFNAVIFGNVPDGPNQVPNLASMRFGSAGQSDRFWRIHSSNLAPANGGDFSFTFSGGNATAERGKLIMRGQSLDLTQLVDGPRVPSKTFASLGAAASNAGAIVWGSDCTVGNPTTGGGTGALLVCDGVNWRGIL